MSEKPLPQSVSGSLRKTLLFGIWLGFVTPIYMPIALALTGHMIVSVIHFIARLFGLDWLAYILWVILIAVGYPVFVWWCASRPEYFQRSRINSIESDEVRAQFSRGLCIGASLFSWSSGVALLSLVIWMIYTHWL